MQFDLSLTPPQIEIVSQPGKTISQAYTVTNNGTATIYLTTSIDRWQPLGDNGEVSYIPDPYPAATFSLLNANLKLGQAFSLAPGLSQQLVLQITPTSNVPNDSYYTFFVGQQPATTFTASGRIGSHLLITTSATSASPQAKISNFIVSPQLKDIFFTPITLNGQIENLTGRYFHIQGTITVTKNGRELSKLTLVPDNVLGQHSRQLRCLDNNLPSVCTLSPPFWPGIYTATLTLDPSIKSPPATVRFFVLPYYILALILVGSLLGYIVYRRQLQTPT